MPNRCTRNGSLPILLLLATLTAPAVQAQKSPIDLKGSRVVDLTYAFDEKTIYSPTSPTAFKLDHLSYGKTEDATSTRPMPSAHQSTAAPIWTRRSISRQGSEGGTCSFGTFRLKMSSYGIPVGRAGTYSVSQRPAERYPDSRIGVLNACRNRPPERKMVVRPAQPTPTYASSAWRWAATGYSTNR